MSITRKVRDGINPENIQQNWNDREFIELVTLSIGKMTSFLNDFDASFKYRMAILNSKMAELEKKMDYIETRIGLNTE